MSSSATRVQRIGGRLQRVPAAYAIASATIRAAGRARRGRQIAAYLGSNERRYLRIGSGSHIDRGWLATDLLPVKPAIVYMDATKPFPLPSGSFDAVQCEHVIEHLTYAGGIAMLEECHRVLRPGGILRIATPDVALVRRLLDARDREPELDSYAGWSNRTYGTPAEARRANGRLFAANRLVRAWGHTFLYDEQTLRVALQSVGFGHIVSVTPGESEHPDLRRMDRHEREVGREANELETLALEAQA